MNRSRHGRGRLMLQPSLLLIMQQGPAHGYELMERLKEFGLGDIDPSLIYRALHGLEAERLISSSWDEKDSQGPPRRVYHLTPNGQEMLAQHLEELKKIRQKIDEWIQAYESHMKTDK
ncbi:PadR family transcriptional regulator [Pelolinea submarina]|uniref:PadR family transcriptional regulator n=1 Tax=Pelolinea submarina TaxID=913107 RepID=A0A3E0AF97_9CHLR|nr:helix-turn-helix transcriptional regulator [Pelolinea submarina]REG10362.1 PadR family transcriptional regulator [Pelolinea submarina]